MKAMKRLAPLLALLLAIPVVAAASPVRYLHVRVTGHKNQESVRVNLPLEVAEKVLPAINHGQLNNGKIRIGHLDANGVNLKAILLALNSSPDGEFVTVQEKDNDVRVAKEHGQLVVHVVDKRNDEHVDVTIPWTVAQALASNTDSDSDNDELNIEAGIQALEKAGDVSLVTVVDKDETVRIWIDSSSTAD